MQAEVGVQETPVSLALSPWKRGACVGSTDQAVAFHDSMRGSSRLPWPPTAMHRQLEAQVSALSVLRTGLGKGCSDQLAPDKTPASENPVLSPGV
jgi:hypothetical protein